MLHAKFRKNREISGDFNSGEDIKGFLLYMGVAVIRVI